MNPRNVPGKTEIAALGLINWRPMHGYLLKQMVEKLGLEQWANLSQSSIYYALGQMTKKGIITTTKEREGKSPERTVFHMTEQGRERLIDHLRTAIQTYESEDLLFYLATSFIDALPIKEAVDLLSTRADNLAEISLHQKEKANNPCMLPHFSALCKAGADHMQVEHDFCRRLIELFSSQPDYFDKIRGTMNEI